MEEYLKSNFAFCSSSSLVKMKRAGTDGIKKRTSRSPLLLVQEYFIRNTFTFKRTGSEESIIWRYIYLSLCALCHVTLIIHRWRFNLLILYIFWINIFYFLSLVLLCAQFSVAKVSDINNHVSKVGFGNWIVAPPPRLKQRKPTWGCPGREVEPSPSLPFLNTESVCPFTFTRGPVSSQAFQTQLSPVEWGMCPPWADRKGNQSWIYFFSIWSSDLL